MLCLDFVTQGGSWPLGLCDIGVFLEALPTGFDWDYCWSGDPKRTQWSRAVIGLAARLLDARIEGVPDHEVVGKLATGLDPVVLAQWGRSESATGPAPELLSQAEGPC